MAITRAQQAKQMLAQGGRIGLKGGADASMADFGTPSTPGVSAGRKGPGPNVSAGGANFRDTKPDRPPGSGGLIYTPPPTKEVRNRQKKLYEDQFYRKGQLPPVGSRPVDLKTKYQRFLDQRKLNAIRRNQVLALRKLGIMSPQALTPTGALFQSFEDFPGYLEGLTSEELKDEVMKIATSGPYLSQQKTKADVARFKQGKDLLNRTLEAEDLLRDGELTQKKFEEIFPGPPKPPDRDGPEPIIPIIPKLIKEEEEEAKRNLGGLSARIGGSLFDFDKDPITAADGGRIGFFKAGLARGDDISPGTSKTGGMRDKPSDREGSSNRERGIMSRGLGPKGTTGNIKDFRDTGPDDRSSFRQTLNQFRVSKGLETGEPSFSQKFKTGLRSVLDLIAMGVISPVGAAELSPEELEQLKKDAGVTTGETTAGAVQQTFPRFLADEYGIYKDIMGGPKATGAIVDEYKGSFPGLEDVPTKELEERFEKGLADPSLMQVSLPGQSRIMAAGGGIADMDREAFILGGIAKGLKKATRAVKKIAKSPIGKAAIGAALFKFGGGSTGILDLIKANPKTSMFLASLAAGAMTPKQDESEFDLDEYYATGKLGDASPTTRIAGSNFDFYGGSVAAADGGLMRLGYQEGGDAEPVAKKTMPLIDMDGMEKDYRETGGFVEMGRMERADDVPARLSKNEFVFTADAVRNAGDGDIDKGAEVMYNMMKNLEDGGNVSEESQGLEGARNMFKTSQRLGEVL